MLQAHKKLLDVAIEQSIALKFMAKVVNPDQTALREAITVSTGSAFWVHHYIVIKILHYSVFRYFLHMQFCIVTYFIIVSLSFHV